MLPKKTRLPSQEFRSGRYQTVATPYFSLKVRTNHAKQNKIGVIVSLSVHKSAVRRNFWKRQTKSVLMGISPRGQDILAILLPKANTLTQKQFKKTLLGAAAQLAAH